jgi:DNA-damage-inducible protein J
MNATTAVNLFARAVLREQRIPFEIVGCDAPFNNPANQTRLRDTMQQMEDSKGLVVRRMDELEAMENA